MLVQGIFIHICRERGICDRRVRVHKHLCPTCHMVFVDIFKIIRKLQARFDKNRFALCLCIEIYLENGGF